MKKWVINHCISYIKNSSLQYSEEKLEEIEYGLESIYILISKTVIIFGIAYLLHVWYPLFLFLMLYNVIRMPSFGLHATKSWICLISSFFVFMGGMYLCLYIQIPISIKTILGMYCIMRIYMNAPADTYKRPIVNQKRRDIYKCISTIIAIIFVFASLFIENKFLGNAFIITLCIQVYMISPLVYKLLGLPYNNYKLYTLDTV